MLNHNKRLIKSKSKILLLALCIFGLLFSYSCNCRNNSTAPVDNGGGTNYIPKTYTAEKTIGSALIVVKSDGSSITPANISFSNATVTSVTVDAGTTGIAADAFKYENGALTMTAFDSVTSTTRQKVTATFSLAPSESRDTLTNPTETVEIEVVKGARITIDDGIGKLFQPDNPDFQFDNNSHLFNFKLAKKWDKANFRLELQDNHNDRDTSGKDVTVGTFKKDVEKLWQTKSPEYSQYCDGVIWTDAQGAGSQTLKVYLKFKFKAEIEVDNPDQEYEIVAPLGGKGNWINS